VTLLPALDRPAPRAGAVAPARVLVVDDSALIRAVLVANLEERGHLVLEAEDGEQALFLCDEEPPDVVLLDLVMPGMSGLEVLDRLHGDAGMRHVPVVCLTGRSDVADIVEAMERGAHDYLRKPFETAELLARVSGALRVKRLADELRTRNVELERVSSTDLLTGLPNRRSADQTLTAQVAHAARHGLPLSVLMIDLDHFKAVNDTYGHAAGDVVLAEVAARLRAGLREGDTVGRWGGEEFLAVLPMTPAAAAGLLADRLCTQVSGSPVRLGAGFEVPVGVSIGCAGGVLDERRLLHDADVALYAAKAAGRGRSRTSADRP
jgi:diguanylate cyclase (GGDEF)-like protein